ncbi:ester cyclase [Haladaptatus sp. NG-WS-4]
MATTGQENKELVRRVHDVLDEQDRDAFAELHVEDIVLHDAGEEIHGVDAVVERELALWNAFPDLSHTMEDVLVEDDRAAYRFTSTGTHEGGFRGIEPTGEEFEITGLGVVRIEDGKFAEIWLNYDSLGIMQQLGVVELPDG